MNEESLAETVLRTTVLVVVALVLALIVMASMKVQFRAPDHAAKKPEPVVVQSNHAPKDHAKDHAKDHPKHDEQ